MRYRNRTLEQFFQKAADKFPVMMVTGPRQIGKTTFLKHLADADRAYVTLDDPMVCALAKDDPALFLQRFQPPILIDEIQYAPELLPHIKMAVDLNRAGGQFWLTGSQQFHLMKDVSESLAGRVGVVHLMGFSQRELQDDAYALPFLPTDKTLSQRDDSPTLLLRELFQRIWLGSFPALYQDQEKSAYKDGSASGKEVSSSGKDGSSSGKNGLGVREENLSVRSVRSVRSSQSAQSAQGDTYSIGVEDSSGRDLFYSSYIQTYIQRDVRYLANVGDASAFLRFLRSCAARTSQMLNMQDLCRDSDIHLATGKRWLSILENSGLVYLLEPFHSNLHKRLVKTPKLYFLDTGLAAYLTEWTSPAVLEAGAMSGAFLETWVFSELLKGWLHNGKRAPFYYYRDKDTKEIDILIFQDGTLYPVEIKKSARPGKDAVRHFSVLKSLKLPIGPGAVISLAPMRLPITETVQAIPVGML